MPHYKTKEAEFPSTVRRYPLKASSGFAFHDILPEPKQILAKVAWGNPPESKSYMICADRCQQTWKPHETLQIELPVLVFMKIWIFLTF